MSVVFVCSLDGVRHVPVIVFLYAEYCLCDNAQCSDAYYVNGSYCHPSNSWDEFCLFANSNHFVLNTSQVFFKYHCYQVLCCSTGLWLSQVLSQYYRHLQGLWGLSIHTIL